MGEESWLEPKLKVPSQYCSGVTGKSLEKTLVRTIDLRNRIQDFLSAKATLHQLSHGHVFNIPILSFLVYGKVGEGGFSCVVLYDEEANKHTFVLCTGLFKIL